MGNINFWQVFISNFESRFMFFLVYILGIAAWDYRSITAGRRKNSTETLRPDTKKQVGVSKALITNNIDPKTLMSNYVAPSKPEPEINTETPSNPDINKNNQKEISLNLFDEMLKEVLTEEENLETEEVLQEQVFADEDREKEKQEKLRTYKLEQEIKAEKERQEALEYGETVY
jgi:hypothetical protein